MDPGHDCALFEIFWGNIPQVERPPIAQLHIEHLVEITIIKLAAPTDAQCAAAHQSVDGGWIETVGEKFEIIVPLPT